MKRAFVDTNVVVRFLTGDPPDMARQALSLFTAADRGEIILIVDEIVIAETVWVLSSFYKHVPRDVVQSVGMLLAHEAIECENKSFLIEALAIFADHRIDFADALIAARMRRRGVSEVYSFDAHFDRLPDIHRCDPADFETADAHR